METPNSKNPGAPLSTGALIIAILALLGTPVVFFLGTGWASYGDGRDGALGLAIGWMFFCSSSVLLGILGRKRAQTAGHKSGLGLTAMIIGLIAELLTIGIVYAIFQVESII